MENENQSQPVLTPDENAASETDVKQNTLPQAAGETAPTAPAAGEPLTEEAFEALIRGPYKKAFDSRVQKILDGRLRKAREDQEALRQTREENQSLRGEREARLRAALDRLEQSAPEVAALYPGFDWRAELQNQTFGRLIAAGVDARSAYETAHREELLHQAMAYAARRTRENVAQSMAARARVPENGSRGSAAVIRTDPARLTPEERLDIRRRVQNGEKIRF